ncbi:MAG: type II toxin-antitoxin system VapC family toxin [Chloroflexi bacterium]|nr:type II toxin-antitoxin system VapC family toxin [Chloroflexota bacterium]
MDRLFVDTGAFIALYDTRDRYHTAATRYYEELKGGRVPLLSTNFIVNEAYTWLQRQAGFGYPAVVRFGNWLRRVSSTAALLEVLRIKAGERRRLIKISEPQKPFALLYTVPPIEEEAWRFFAQYGSTGATYTDCVSFAVMDMLSLERAFTFDEHFAAAGFVQVPEG